MTQRASRRALRVLTLSFLSCGGLRAVASGAAAPEELRAPLPDEAASAEERMVLRLHEGKCWRGSARRGPDGWELRQGTGWQVVPAHLVLSARPERELLAEARTRRAALAADDYAARAAHAEWMLVEGLQAEAVQELDRVLGFEPDQPTALRALRENPPAVALPEGASEAQTRAELLRFGAKAGPVGRELVIARLAALADRGGLEADLERELVDSSVRRRAFAAHALRRLAPGTQLEGLLGRAVLDSSEEVRQSAALALRDSGESAVVVPVVRALGSARGEVRANAAQALGTIGHAAAVEPLVLHLLALSAQGSSAARVPHSHIYVGKELAYIQDYDVEVAQFQVAADPQINVLVSGAVLDTGVHSVRSVAFAHERKVTRHALERLTGADPGDTTDAWRRWWEEHQHAWRSEVRSRPSADASQSASTAHGSAEGAARGR